MSKSKSKSVAKATKPDALTKVKDASVTKHAQTGKAKSKDLAKQVAVKQDKRDKKAKKSVKEPTPEPSESEESSSSDSSDESDREEVTKPALNGKSNGVHKAGRKAAPSNDSEGDDDSASASDSDSSESEAEASKANGTSKKAITAKPDVQKSAETSDESDSDSDASVAKGALKTAAAASDSDSSDESSADEAPAESEGKSVAAKQDIEAGSESNAEDDSDSDSSEEEKEPEKPNKRKAEDDGAQNVKKPKPDVNVTDKGANLFVGNLSWNVDEAWLREVFEEFGELAGVRIMTERDSGRSKGFGYVEFTEAENAARAQAAKSGADLDGRALNVDFANARPDNSQKQENRRKSYGDQVSEPSDTLFLGNLSFDVGQEEVTEAFAPHGTIQSVRLPTDRETGQPKGFGYVTFTSIDEAKVALKAMSGAYIGGRLVRLDFSTPRPQNNDSPSRGRGGFGGRGGGRGGARGGRGGRGGSFGGARGGRGGSRGGSTNRGGFGDFSGKKTSFA